jgi:signal transduction histidine kinase
MELLQSQLAAAGVRIEARLAAAEDRVLADPEELKNVFVNLLVNAEEAMPEGGAVHLATENSMGADSPRMEETRLERTIRVRIRDEGPGVPEEVREQIFRPFVTTKPGGTGFGLAVVRMAVQEHQGRVYLESAGAPDPWEGRGGGGDRSETSGRGATFVVELPLAPASSSPAGEGPGAERGSSVPAVNQSEEAS